MNCSREDAPSCALKTQLAHCVAVYRISDAMYWIFDFRIHLQCRMYVWLRSTPTIYAASGRLVEMIYTKIQFLLHYLLYIASEMR